MHQSGITVDNELKKAFQECCEGTNTWMHITIEDDQFKFIAAGAAADAEANWAAVQGSLKQKTPGFFFIQNSANMWLMISFIPDNSQVRLKMLFASSSASLKQGLGSAKFVANDFAINMIDECTWENYKKQTSEEVDVMTFEEKTHLQTEYDSAALMGTGQTAVIAGIPIKIADGAVEAIKGLKEGKHSSVELILDGETEVLGVGAVQDMSVADLIALFPPKEPRYFLHNHAHKDKEGGDKKTLVFVYYCPMTSAPKLKMFYSTCKAHILTCLAALEFDKPVNLECDSASECSEDRIMKEIYPPEEVKTSFAKPKARGRRAIKAFQE